MIEEIKEAILCERRIYLKNNRMVPEFVINLSDACLQQCYADAQTSYFIITCQPQMLLGCKYVVKPEQVEPFVIELYK